LAYKIAFKKSVSKDLKRLVRAEAGRILDIIASELPEQADQAPVLKGKFAGFRKFRVGNYRVIYVILEDTVLITRIHHRKDAYR
jgi:mRNA interferase RelE/StbE